MKRMELKWWFVIPLAILTVGSTYWLLTAVGLGLAPEPRSFARFVLLFIVLNAFYRLYSHVIRAVVSLLSPMPAPSQWPR